MTPEFDLNLEKFGKMTYLETLCYYDRDLAMSYKDEFGNLYYVFLKSTPKPIDKWLVLPVTPETLGRIERQELYMKDWAELLNRAETQLYSFDDPEPGQVNSILEWNKEEISEYAESLLS